MMGMIAGASAGSTAVTRLIMAGGAMGGMMWMIGAAIVGSTIGGLTIGGSTTALAANSNKVVKQHDVDQESTPLTSFGSL